MSLLTQYFPVGREFWQGLLSFSEVLSDPDVTTENVLIDRPDAIQSVSRGLVQILARAHLSWYRKYAAVDSAQVVRTAVMSLSEVQSLLASTRLLPGGYNLGVLDLAFAADSYTVEELFGDGGILSGMFSTGDFFQHLFGAPFPSEPTGEDGET